MNKRVCVIGGGISGLCVAHHLSRAGVEVTLYEKSSSVGGNIKTEIRDGFLIEHGPNSTLSSHGLLDLIDQLGISDQIAPPNQNAKLRYILRDGRLAALPSKMLGMISNKAFSMKAKLRLLKEPFVRSRSTENESVASFFERRFGKEIVDYAVDPFISGIYAGDAEKLAIRHAFSKLFEMERDYGSVLRGVVLSREDSSSKLPKGTPRSLTFINGMQVLTDALSTRLNEKIKLNTGVSEISKTGPHQYIAKTGSGDEIFDAVVICTPARAAARITERLHANISDTLEAIQYPPVSIVFTAFKREDVNTEPNGFGVLVPGVESRKILGSLWTSSVFEKRAPDGYHLFTTFIGGTRNPDFALMSEAQLLDTTIEELTPILGITGEPAFFFVKKWERAIPQYEIGYDEVLEAIGAFSRDNPGVFFCSNFYKGISVSDCVKNGSETAKEVTDYLNR